MQENIILEFTKDLRAQLPAYLNASNCKAGELPQGRDGIYCIAEPSDEPDRYTGVMYQNVGIIARYKTDADAWDIMRRVYPIYVRRIFETESLTVDYSNPLGQITDLDRDAEGNKMLKLSVLLIARSKVIVS